MFFNQRKLRRLKAKEKMEKAIAPRKALTLLPESWALNARQLSAP
jgi:hypothetical protein